jgi:hypothetical protein
MLNQKVEWPLQYGIMAIPVGKAMNQNGNMKKQGDKRKKQKGNIQNQGGII